MYLGNNGIDKNGSVAIAAVLMTNTTLETLDLQENSLGVYGAILIGDALMTSNNTLRKLNLAHQLKKKIGPDGCIHLAKALRLGTCKDSLKSLILSKNHIGFEGCRHLAGAMLVNKTLTELDISGNNFITLEGSMQLAQAMAYNHTLEWLGIGNHKLHVKCVQGKLNADAGKGAGDNLLMDRATAIAHVNRIMTEKPILRCAKHESDLASFECWGICIGSNSVVEDETAILLSTIIKTNRLHSHICVANGVIPLQQLVGLPDVKSVDLSNKQMTSSDAIVVGALIADNSYLQSISLHGNNFAASEGENWIAYALNRNTTLKIDRLFWTPAQMYTDGYKSLAALNGTSASGIAIEPNRIEGWLWKGIYVFGGFMFYVSTCIDIYTVTLYSSEPSIYSASWVYLGATFICLPTFLICVVTFLTLIKQSPSATIKQILIVLFQLSKMVEIYRSVVAGMETVPCKFIDNCNEFVL